jgi:hypothetical protein
MPVDGLD